jgi:hypothetical protein
MTEPERKMQAKIRVVRKKHESVLLRTESTCARGAWPGPPRPSKAQEKSGKSVHAAFFLVALE